MNGKIFSADKGKISANVWQSWKKGNSLICMPENWSASFKIENKDTAPLENISVKIVLHGSRREEKNFPAFTLEAGETKNFSIPLGGLEFSNDCFEIEIWLLNSKGEPLFGFWNGKSFGNKGTIKLYLQNYSA